jgi:hypothetical protein
MSPNMTVGIAEEVLILAALGDEAGLAWVRRICKALLCSRLVRFSECALGG